MDLNQQQAALAQQQTQQPQQQDQQYQQQPNAELMQQLQELLAKQGTQGNQQDPAQNPQQQQIPQQPQQTQQTQQLQQQPQQQQLDTNALGFEVSHGTQTALSMLGAVGVDANAVAALAQDAMAKNANLDLAAFQMQFGDKAAYALQAAQSLLQDGSAYRDTLKQQAYASVGGEQQWLDLTNKFKATAPHLQPAVQQLVNNLQFDAAVALMRSVVPVGQQPMQGAVTASAQPSVQNGVLTQTQFLTAYDELKAKYPNQSFETGQAGALYKELLRMRQAGIQAGI
jgi:hypothetical protein|nr:MAG TPA: capsid assembly protein [Caudoviricetes sp.]